MAGPVHSGQRRLSPIGSAAWRARVLRLDFFTNRGEIKAHGHSESVSTQCARFEAREEHGTGARGLPATPRRLHARLHDDAEKAELGNA